MTFPPGVINSSFVDGSICVEISGTSVKLIVWPSDT